MKAMTTIIAVLAMCVAAGAQTIVRSETLAVDDLGNVKLIKVGDKYLMKIETGNRFQTHISVALGEREQALHLLEFLRDTELNVGDVIDLENETGNAASWVALSEMSGYLIASPGGRLDGWLRKATIKKYIGIIKNN